jgi:hypothetical protein
MKKRNLSVVLLSFGVLISLILISNYIFAAQQSISISNSTGQAGVFQIYNITVQNTDPKLNITQVNLTVSVSYLNITSFNTSTGATIIPSLTILQFVNNSISLIKNGTIGYFWLNAMTNQTGTFNITVTTLDNNSITNSTNLSVTVIDTIPPTISFVNQTPSGGSTGLTSIPVNVSASDSGSGLSNVTIYLSNSSGLIGGSPIVSTSSPSYANFTGLLAGTYNLWAIAFDNAGNNASTSNYSLTTINSTTVACVPNWVNSTGSCVNGNQTVTWSDSNNCNITTNQPATINQTCTSAPTCVTNWSCTDWTPAICSSTNGSQTRTCTDSNGCSAVQVETRDCALGSAITTNSTSQTGGASSFSLSSAFYIVIGIIIISVIGVIVILVRLRKKSYSTDFGNKQSGYKSFSPRNPPSGPTGFSGS